MPATAQDVVTTDVVFPGRTNHYGTLFGGDALEMLGRTAFIAATRTLRQRVVIAHVQDVEFRSPVRSGEIVEFRAHVVDHGRTSLRIETTADAEELFTGDRRIALRATFTMVAVDAGGRPEPVDPDAWALATPIEEIA
jgi:acyl-CoA hydrolase